MTSITGPYAYLRDLAELLNMEGHFTTVISGQSRQGATLWTQASPEKVAECEAFLAFLTCPYPILIVIVR